MTELRFHRAIYLGTCVDEAVKRFAGFAEFALEESADHWVVKLSSATPERERQVAGELGNYALGLTVSQSSRQERSRDAQERR